MAIRPELKELINSNAPNLSALADIHPDFFRALLDGGFIVDGDADEYAEYVSETKSKESQSSSYEITINPTLRCNLRCWYCYEDHRGSSMSKETLDSILLFIENKISEENIKNLSVSFFGGEPLLEYDKVVAPVIKRMLQLSVEHPSVNVDFGFTSNAVFLSEAVSDFLSGTHRQVSFQVPFDGNQVMHDLTKLDNHGNGTFNTIFQNVIYGLKKGIRFVVRCNYTNKNIGSFKELVDSFAPYYMKYPEQLRFSFQKVWQEKDSPELSTKLRALEAYCRDAGIMDGHLATSGLGTCYADSPNSVIVNYNGSIFKCTARNFDEGKREGVLNADGTISFNSRYYGRLDSRFSNAVCRTCAVFPICNVCTQKRLEHWSEDSCLRGYDELRKMELVRTAIRSYCKNN